MTIPDGQLEKVASELEGTCNTISMVLERLDIDADISNIEDALLNLNLERCPGCEWWMESWELVDIDGNVVGCEQCQQEMEGLEANDDSS